MPNATVVSGQSGGVVLLGGRGFRRAEGCWESVPELVLGGPRRPFGMARLLPSRSVLLPDGRLVLVWAEF